MEAHTLVGEFKICCLNIFYQYNGVLPVLVVESCPSVVACGQCRGVPPQRGQSCDVRCTKGILLIIRYQYHIVFAYRCEGVGCTPPIYLHPLTEASVGGMLAVGRIVGVTTTEGGYAKV